MQGRAAVFPRRVKHIMCHPCIEFWHPDGPGIEGSTHFFVSSREKRLVPQPADATGPSRRPAAPGSISKRSRPHYTCPVHGECRLNV